VISQRKIEISQQDIEQATEYIGKLKAAIARIICTQGPYTLDSKASTTHTHVWICQACGGTVRMRQSFNPTTVGALEWTHARPKE
jgi:hypothetical protein